MDEEKMMEILTQFSKENEVLSREHVKDIVGLLTEKPEENWNKSDRTYAGFLKELGAEDERWFRFAGMTLCAGIELDIPIEKIVEDIMESVHGLDLETEVPLTYEQVVEEMNLIKNESE